MVAVPEIVNLSPEESGPGCRVDLKWGSAIPETGVPE